MIITPQISRIHSPFLCCPLKISSLSPLSGRPLLRNHQRSHVSYPLIRADLDQNTIVAISVGVVSIAVGVGVPIFYESQIDNAAKRDNTQPCFPCAGSGAHYLKQETGPARAHIWRWCNRTGTPKFSKKCRFCTGTGNVTVDLGGGENEVSRCINCDGAGSLTCTTCQGSGIQPRYLDRREFKDDD